MPGQEHHLSIWRMLLPVPSNYDQNDDDVSESVLAILNEISEFLEDEINKFESQQPDLLVENPYSIKHGFSIGKLQQALVEHEVCEVSGKIQKVINKCMTEDEDSVPSEKTAAATRLWLNCLYFLDHHPTSNFKYRYWHSTILFEFALCSDEPHNLYAVGILARILNDKCKIVEDKKECLEILKNFLPKFLNYLPVICLNEKQKKDEVNEFPPHKKLKFNEEDSIINDNEFDISNSVETESDNEQTEPYWNLSGAISDGLRQRLYLDFLISIGEEPSFVNTLVRNKTVAVAIHLAKRGNQIVQFKAFQFLATICHHNKCAFEIVQSRFVELAISMPKQSLISSTGASLFLHKLSMNEEAMKIVCDSTNLEKLVKYTLELVQGCHVSATCNVVLFFSESFQHENFIRVFDKLHGIQKLIFFMKTSELFSLFREGIHYTELNSTRPVLKSFSICFEKYFIKHLLVQTGNMEAALLNSNWSGNLANPLSKITRTDLTLNELERGVEFVRNVNCIEDVKVRSVADQFINNGTHIEEFARDKKAMKVLIRIISMGFEWEESFCSSQIRKSSLTALMIVTLSKRVQPILINGWIAESYLNGSTSCIGMLLDIINPKVTLPSNIITRSEGAKSVRKKTNFPSHYEVFNKLALQTLLTCAYQQECEIFSRANTLDKSNKKSIGSTEVILNDHNSEVWRMKLIKNIRERQGIHVLTYLLQTLKSFQIGILICKILLCLVQSSQARTVIGNMPLFRSGKLLCQATFSQSSGSKKDCIMFSLVLNNLLNKVTGNSSQQYQPCRIDENESNKIKFHHLTSSNLDMDDFKEGQNKTKEERQNDSRSSKISFTKGSKCRGPSPLWNTKSSTYKKTCVKVKTGNYKRDSCWMLNIRSAVVNIATTLDDRQLNFRQKHAMNKWNEYPFSKFCPSYFINEGYHDPTFLCSAFYDNGNKLLIGDNTGSLTVHNLNNANKEDRIYAEFGTTENITKIRSLSTHRESDCFIVNLIGSLCHWVLYRLNEDDHTITNIPIQDYTNVFYAEFAKKRVDRAIGTRHNQAMIFDLNTGKRLFCLCKLTSYDRQSWNRATFSWDDCLILSSSMLWDPRVSHNEPIHSFDVFSNQGSTLFHPNGREIILNSSIWDMRMFNLINTVPDFNCSKLYFNSTGSVIYSVKVDDAKNFDEEFVGSNLRTYSAHDYKHLYTFEVENDIINFAADNLDRKIALVEKIEPRKSDSEDSRDDDHDDKTKCRLYDIGKSDRKHEYFDELYQWNQPDNDTYDLWEPCGTDFLISDAELDDPGDLK